MVGGHLGVYVEGGDLDSIDSVRELERLNYFDGGTIDVNVVD